MAQRTNQVSQNYLWSQSLDSLAALSDKLLDWVFMWIGFWWGRRRVKAARGRDITTSLLLIHLILWVHFCFSISAYSVLIMLPLEPLSFFLIPGWPFPLDSTNLHDRLLNVPLLSLQHPALCLRVTPCSCLYYALAHSYQVHISIFFTGLLNIQCVSESHGRLVKNRLLNSSPGVSDS